MKTNNMTVDAKEVLLGGLHPLSNCSEQRIRERNFGALCAVPMELIVSEGFQGTEAI